MQSTLGSNSPVESVNENLKPYISKFSSMGASGSTERWGSKWYTLATCILLGYVLCIASI